MDIRIAGSTNFCAKKVTLPKSRVQTVLEKLQQEGRVQVISKEESAKLDRELAVGFQKIKEEYTRKAAMSWHRMKNVVLD